MKKALALAAVSAVALMSGITGAGAQMSMSETMQKQHEQMMNDVSVVKNEHNQIMKEHKDMSDNDAKIMKEHQQIMEDHKKIMNDYDRIMKEHKQITDDHKRK